MKNKLKLVKYFIFFHLTIILLISGLTQAQTFTLSSNSSPSVTNADAVGVYIANGATHDGGKPVYVKISGTNSNVSYVFSSLGFWTIYSSVQDVNYWYYWTQVSQPSTFPIGSFWSDAGGSAQGTAGPTGNQNTTSNITFTNGSGYSTLIPTLPATNHGIGRFQLTGSTVGGVLTSVTISLSGTRSGVSNYKLWSGAISGTPLSTVATDASSITFSGFNSLVDNSSGTTYFISVDLSAGATGGVTATIPSQASFSFVSGSANAPSSFTNAALSSGASPLPIELFSFTTKTINGSVILMWSTASELNNYGFEVERNKTMQSTNWEKIGFVLGSGNSSSPKEYSFSDKSPLAGNIFYRLKQIDLDGTFKYYSPEQASVKIEQFSLNQNYPNPFNPVTIIKYSLPEKSNVKLIVYNLLGQEVAELVNKEEEGGVYNVEFNATKLSSGVYFYKLNAGSYSSVKKLLITK